MYFDMYSYLDAGLFYTLKSLFEVWWEYLIHLTKSILLHLLFYTEMDRFWLLCLDYYYAANGTMKYIEV